MEPINVSHYGAKREAYKSCGRRQMTFYICYLM